MSESNIEKFDYVVGMVFAMLYESFPRRVVVDYMALNKDKNLSFANDESFEYCAVDWLEKSGYIWILEKENTHVKAVLSPKGLEILKSFPSSISNTSEAKSIGENLVNLVKEGAKETTKKNIKILTSWVLSKGLNYASSLVEDIPSQLS